MIFLFSNLFAVVVCLFGAASISAQQVLPPPKTILAIGAHAGEIELTAGALMIKHHKLGARVVILQMTQCPA